MVDYPFLSITFVPMISKNKAKLIRSLERKKCRKELGLFVAEGPKVVGDLIQAGRKPQLLVSTPEGMQQLERRCISWSEIQCEHIEASAEELQKVSFLQHPQDLLALFPTNEERESRDERRDSGVDGLVLALDGVQDPGNLGTIIRIADWFGIETIYCSPDTVDVYNPKVVQATMGSIARVHIIYKDIAELIGEQPDDIPVYGTVLDGDNIYQVPLQPCGIIVMGNEGNGISEPVRQRLTHRLLIPNYPPDRPTAESLNVAVATAIVCAEFRKRATPNPSPK